MLRLRASENVIYTSTKGETPTDEDFEKLVPFLEEISQYHNSTHWYFELEDVKEWETESRWKNPDFNFRNKDNIKKIALVGVEDLRRTMTSLVQSFREAEVRFYRPEEKTDARLWLE